MAQLDIVEFPNEFLRTVTQEVTPIRPLANDVQTLIFNMIETMYAHQALGLAAIQIGRLERIIVIDVDKLHSGKATGEPLVLINPVLEKLDGKMLLMREGCLSFPEQSVDIERPSRIILNAFNIRGNPIRVGGDGDMLSRVLQHEYDHLENRLMIDHVKKEIDTNA